MDGDVSSERPEGAPAPVPVPAPAAEPPRGRRPGGFGRAWRRLTLLPLAALLCVLALALAGLWVWAGTPGSLATALRWAGRWTPLTAQGARGDIRHGGTVDVLTWAQNGLRVQVRGARIAWSPGALLHKQLYVRTLAATAIEIEDRSAPAPPAAGPPASLALPLAVRVDALAVGELRWAGPPAIVVRDVAGSYRYGSGQHALALDHARVETTQGSAGLRARVTQQATAPLALDATLEGVLRNRAAPPLTVQATLRGPLADMQARLDARTAQDEETPAQPRSAQPQSAQAQAQVQARIRPWAAQPLVQARARVARLDLQTLLAAFWPDAPRTAITGTLDLTPIAADGWHVSADLDNTERSLPLAHAQADVDWQGRTLTVHALQASGADSQLAARGHWQVDARQGVVDATLTAPGAALAVTGEVAPDRGAGRVQVDVRDAARLLAWARALPGLGTALAWSPGVQGQARLDADWRGGWRDAQSAAVQATLTAPTLTAPVTATGGGAPVRVQDLRARLEGTLAQARLAVDGIVQQQNGQGDWGARGGALHLAVSGGRVAGAGRSSAPAAAAATAWRLSIDRLEAQAHDPQWGAWTLASAAPVTLALGPGKALDVGAGVLTLDEAAPFRGGARAAQRGTHAAHGAADAAGTRAGVGSQTDANAAPDSRLARADDGAVIGPSGSMSASVPASAPRLTLAWDASRWNGRALATSGRVTGLSFAWVERLAGEQLQATGLTGDVALTGEWRARIGPGQPLDVHASLARTAGDLTLIANDPATGLQTRVAAGLQEARVTVDGNGQAVRAQARWMSDRAGQVTADLSTQLAPTPDGMGWAWPDAAPLAGQVSARLPQLSVWSTLAPPGWRMRGVLAADARIAGTREDPQVTGTLTADRLALRSVVDGVQLRGGQLRARFDGARLVIDAFSLHGADWRDGTRAGRQNAAGGEHPGSASGTGNTADNVGGTLTATGEAGWIDGRAQARLTATLDHLRASIRPDRQITVSGAVQAALDGRQVTARGQITIDQARIDLPDQSAPTLSDDVVVHDAQDRALRGQVTADAGKKTPKPAHAPGASGAPGAPEAGGALRADVQVRIDLGQQFRVQGQGIDTRLTGALTLAAQGPLTALPRLTGAIDTADGRFHAYGQNLDIARGVIRFTGAVDNPTLDILALRPIYDANQKAGVQVQGTAMLPRVRLYSDPALPDSQTLAWLLLGHAAPATGAESAMLQSAALALLGGRDSEGLASHFGLDELSLGNTTDANGEQNTSVTLGKRLSSRLYAAYQQSLSGATGSLLIFYELSRRWQLRAQAGQNAAVDLIYSLSFD